MGILLNSKTKKIIAASIACAALGAISLFSFYTIKTGEEAIILRFGRHVKTVTEDGLKFKIPFLDEVLKTNTQTVRRLEFGFRITNDGEISVDEELTMITSDENLISAETIVQYRIQNIEDYYFNVKGPVQTLRVVAESTIRRCIGNHTLDEALTDNKSGIQSEIKEDLQNICNEYGLGIVITDVQLQDVQPPAEVQQSFKDVTDAREEKEASINSAKAVENKLIPDARGKAAEIINLAEAYKTERINKAQGDVEKFNKLLDEYKRGSNITKKRLYLEMLEDILPNVDKYIVDEQSGALNIISVDGTTTLPSSGAKLTDAN